VFGFEKKRRPRIEGSGPRCGQRATNAERIMARCPQRVPDTALAAQPTAIALFSSVMRFFLDTFREPHRRGLAMAALISYESA
jgi:hypothetical protein